MSKPDPAGGSLESILASIRMSLSEQSTDALSEPPPASAAPDKGAKPTRRHGLAQRLAGAAVETATGDRGRGEDDLSDLLEAPSANSAEPIAGVAAPTAASSATQPPPASEAPAGKDPLWFLTRRDEDVITETGTHPEANTASQAAEPKLTRLEVLRASMPPFFGSSSDGVLPATAPVEAAAPVAGASKPAATQGVAPATRAVADPALEQEVSLVAAAAETAAARPQHFASSSRANGRAPVEPESAKGAVLADDTPHNRALETMVLDLLKPMLSQWLDENMPRLVAEALSEEVQRTRAAKGDANKT